MAEWTISAKQLRSLYALDELVDKGMPTGGSNTNSAITYGTADALERRGLARITVDAGSYRVFVTPAGREYAAKMRAAGRR